MLSVSWLFPSSWVWSLISWTTPYLMISIRVASPGFQQGSVSPQVSSASRRSIHVRVRSRNSTIKKSNCELSLIICSRKIDPLFLRKQESLCSRKNWRKLRRDPVAQQSIEMWENILDMSQAATDLAAWGTSFNCHIHMHIPIHIIWMCIYIYIYIYLRRGERKPEFM